MRPHFIISKNQSNILCEVIELNFLKYKLSLGDNNFP